MPRARRPRLLVLVAVLLAAGAAAFVLLVWSGGPPSCAALPAACHVAPTGSDTGSCSAARPCRSFARAYRGAHPGQTVVVAAGSYGPQSIPFDRRKRGGADVVFRPAPGASVRLAGLSITASHVNLRDMSVTAWAASGSDLTLRRLHAGTFYLTGDRVRVLGGVYGPYAPACASGRTFPALDNPTVSANGTHAPVGVEIRGALFHDMSNVHCPASHMDCLQVAAAVHLVVSGNRFVRCDVNDLILTGDFGAMRNITVERNVFEPTTSGELALNWNKTRDCPGAVVRYNTVIASGVQVACSVNRSARFYGNIVPSLSDFDCGTKTAVQWANVAPRGEATATCGRGSVVVPDASLAELRRIRAVRANSRYPAGP